jgi:hypothetical protein
MAKAKLAMPETYGKVSKSFMVEFMKTRDEDDKAWFISLITNENNQKTTNGKADIDIKKVRKAFCEHFEEFTSLIPKKKSTDDYVKMMISDIEGK